MCSTDKSRRRRSEGGLDLVSLSLLSTHVEIRLLTLTLTSFDQISFYTSELVETSIYASAKPFPQENKSSGAEVRRREASDFLHPPLRRLPSRLGEESKKEYEKSFAAVARLSQTERRERVELRFDKAHELSFFSSALVWGSVFREVGRFAPLRESDDGRRSIRSKRSKYGTKSERKTPRRTTPTKSRRTKPKLASRTSSTNSSSKHQSGTITSLNGREEREDRVSKISLGPRTSTRTLPPSPPREHASNDRRVYANVA